MDDRLVEEVVMQSIEIHPSKLTPCDFGDYFSLVADHEVMAMITERALEADEAK